MTIILKWFLGFSGSFRPIFSSIAENIGCGVLCCSMFIIVLATDPSCVRGSSNKPVKCAYQKTDF